MNLIEKQIAEAKTEIAKREVDWLAVRYILEPIVTRLEDLGIEPKFFTSLDINFTGDAHKLAAVVRILRVAGFTSNNPDKPKPNQTGWYSWFRKEGVDIEIWLNFSSSVCRRVKVGTKMVEQDIYETVCGERVYDDSQPLIDATP
jgi:hypothetical protein